MLRWISEVAAVNTCWIIEVPVVMTGSGSDGADGEEGEGEGG